MGFSPAILQISTLASVCPVRSSTPPFFAINGKICPGRAKSLGFESSLQISLIVISRSNALTPVFASFASTEIVNAVS